MTNHDKLAGIIGYEEPVETESVKMLLERISGDVERGLFESNYDKYLLLHKSQIEWLNSKNHANCAGGDGENEGGKRNPDERRRF